MVAWGLFVQPYLVYSVLVAVKRQEPAVTAVPQALHRVEDQLGSQPLIGGRSLYLYHSLSVVVSIG